MLGRSPAKPTPWRALAEQLVDEGCESIYLTRLRAQHDVRAHVDTLAEEVAEEMARALGRTTSRVDYAFACLERDRQRAHDAAAAVLKLRVPELRDELRRHGLPVGGNKPELRARLMPVATADAVEAFDAQRQVCRKERRTCSFTAGPRLQDGQPRRGGDASVPPPRSSPRRFLEDAPRRTTRSGDDGGRRGEELGRLPHLIKMRDMRTFQRGFANFAAVARHVHYPAAFGRRSSAPAPIAAPATAHRSLNRVREETGAPPVSSHLASAP